MRRFLSLLLVLSLVLYLSSCAGLSLSSRSSETAPEGMLRSPEQPATPDPPIDTALFYDEETGQWDSETYDKANRIYSEYRAAVCSAADAYDSSALSAFYCRAIPLLVPADQSNAVCSPLNIYLALAMLAQITDGDSRSQILAAVGADDPDALFNQVKNIWAANYRNGDMAKSLLASSIWLRDGLSFRKDTLDRLADIHRASAYSGKPGTEQMDKALRKWLNDATGHLLEDQIDRISLPENLAAALVTALYYKAPWTEGFSREMTYQGDFTTASGRPVTASYLFESRIGSVYAGDGFTASAKALADGSVMWFLLPDEGVSPEELLRSTAVTDLLYGSVTSDQYIVRLSVPKFDISAHLDLMPVLAALGITDVMDDHSSDFSPLIDASGRLALTSASHGARLLLDEDGVEAAAYTILSTEATSAMDLPEEIDFVLDRPFVFAMTSQAGDLLFVGTVGDPTA